MTLHASTAGSAVPAPVTGVPRGTAERAQPLAGVLQAGPTRIELSITGDVLAIRTGTDLLVSQYLPSRHDAMVGALALRRHDGDVVRWAMLVGGRSSAEVTVDERCARWTGHALGLGYTVTLTLDPAGDLWVWRVDLAPAGPTEGPARVELVLAQDLALAPAATSASSEPYVSQYLAHHVLTHPVAGTVLATRQTMALAPRLPLVLTALAEGAVAHLTDGFSVHGSGARLDGVPAALAGPGWRSGTYQYEMAMPALLGRGVDPAAPHTLHAVGAVVPDYRGDLDDALAVVPGLLDRAVALAATTAPASTASDGDVDRRGVDVPAWGHGIVPQRSLLVSAPLLAGRDLTDAELVDLTGGPGSVLHPERASDGTLLSYFTPDATHVVTRAKELAVERTHGHVLKAGSDVAPSDDILSATVYAAGVFASHVVVGNTTANRFVSVQRNHLNLLRSSGVRVLVRQAGAWRLLGVPSALLLDLGGARWVYATPDGLLEVRTTVRADSRGLEVRVDADRPVDLLITADVELGGGSWSARTALDGRALVFRADPGTDVAEHCPDLVYALASPDGGLGDDAPLFADGLGRGTPLVTAAFAATMTARVVLTGDLDGEQGALAAAAHGLASPIDVPAELAAHRDHLAALTRHLHVEGSGRLAELNVLVPWFAQNALVHFLVPHGLEQYSGAAWGTRDVCQGPLELALAFGHRDVARDLVLRVFARQFPDGTWPQWFMFDAYGERYQDDAHGDVVVWPLLALVEYLDASGDVGVLDVAVPFWDHEHRRPGTRPEPVAEHVRRILAHVRTHRAPGTGLPSYGEGDWDDTLQPAQASMRREMASSWTAALLYQAARSGAELLRGTAHEQLGAALGVEADGVAAQFTERMVVDGVLAGYVVFAAAGSWPVIHPSDHRTGLSYRLIPMTRSIIAGLFSEAQALAHEALVAEHLHYPDGVRLMDRPAPYQDGVTRFFRRGEQATNVGREVGLMYTHAHIRYVEALAALGRDSVVTELLRISPVGQHERLATSLPRQRNCYFSSSDADFPDRYVAAAEWDRLRAGAADPVGVRGGWRVYSSGPGIYLRQVVQGALGLVERADGLVVDPALAVVDDGTVVRIDLAGAPRTVRYHVTVGDEPVRVLADGRALAGVDVPARYRRGGLHLTTAQLDGVRVLDVHVGADRGPARTGGPSSR